MKYTVYEGKQPVGELTMEAQGLYYAISCDLGGSPILRRIYGIHGKDSYYLGIPDEKGHFKRKISKKNLPLPEGIIASTAEPGSWLPWRGRDFGPELWDCMIQKNGEILSLAISPQEWEAQPQWKGKGRQIEIGGRPMVLLDLNAPEEEPPVEKNMNIKIDNGGDRNETIPQIHSTAIDPLLLADLPADYDYGGSGESEAHSHNL